MKIKRGKRGVIRHLAITSVAGAIFWVIGELLFPALTEKMWTPLGIALYFLIFTVLVAVLLFVFSVSKVDASKRENKRNLTDGIAVGAALMAGLVLFSCLFEFLYELGGHDTADNTSYVFLVDDSGSMAGTEEVRTNAIKEVMENNADQIPYAVYRFSDYAELIKPMEYYRPGDERSIDFGVLNGGTEILNSIKTVLNDIKNGKLDKAGFYPKILLVSDGGAFCLGLKNVTRKCVKSGISISTIGVGGCDESLLRKIADNTGGVFVYCDDVSQLSESLEQAKATNTERNLLSERFAFKNNGLYGFLRILFLCLLGLAWSFAKASLFTDESVKWDTVIIFSAICCTVSVLLLEFLAGTAVSIRLLRLILCVLWAATYGTFGDKRNSQAIIGVASGAGLDGLVPGDLADPNGLGKKEDGRGKARSLSYDDFASTQKDQPSFNVDFPFDGNPLAGMGGSSNGDFTSNPLGGAGDSSNGGGFSSDVFGSSSGSSGSAPFASDPFGSSGGSSKGGNPFGF